MCVFSLDPFVPFIYVNSHLRFRLGPCEKVSSEAVEASESEPAPTPAASEVVVDPDESYAVVGGEMDRGVGATA